MYYVKTANPEANAGRFYGTMYGPAAGKLANHIVIDGQVLEPKLQQAENEAGEPLYVNQYGELKPFSEVAG